MNTDLQPTIRVEIPDWALHAHPTRGLASLRVARSLGPEDLDEALSTHMLGTGLVADSRWPWNASTDDSFVQLISEPWRAPGTRLLGSFKTAGPSRL